MTPPNPYVAPAEDDAGDAGDAMAGIAEMLSSDLSCFLVRSAPCK